MRPRPVERLRDTTRELRAVAYDPGPTPGTGLSRHDGALVRAVWRLLATPMVRPLIARFNSRKAAGETLAKLALGLVGPPDAQVYAVLHGGRLTWPPPSELAQSDATADALWRDSAALAGGP